MTTETKLFLAALGLLAAVTLRGRQTGTAPCCPVCGVNPCVCPPGTG